MVLLWGKIDKKNIKAWENKLYFNKLKLLDIKDGNYKETEKFFEFSFHLPLENDEEMPSIHSSIKAETE